MESAKAKVSEFLHKDRKHDTTVRESVAPAVTHETVKPHQHENVTTAVDREVHQDHHHTSVQPVMDKNVLPEQHHFNELSTERREFKHGNDEELSRALKTEASQFKDESVTSPTTTSQKNEPTVAGEHVHHHVHETIQPVVHRETVQPHVVHSVAKVHEKHHNPAQVHETSALPPMDMSDFKARGGHLTGREERMDEFEGCPRNVHNDDADKGGLGGLVGSQPHGTSGGSSGAFPSTNDNGTSGLRHTGPGSAQPQGNSALSNTTSSKRDSAIDSPTHTKPSMMDKLNPKVDANGDGKAGFLK